MSYDLSSFSNTLHNEYPVFIELVKYTHIYYSYQESLLAIIAGKREYDKAHYIMNELLKSFYVSFENKSIVYKYDKESLFEKFLHINDKLISCIQKYYDKKQFTGLEFYTKLKIEDKLKTCTQIIRTILKTPKTINIGNYNKTAYFEYDFSNIRNTIILFYYLIQFYELLFSNDNKLNLKHVNNKEVFVSEFFMFLSHFTFAFLVDRELYPIEQHKNAQNFILNNLHRAVTHLERGVLDILKIMVASVATSKDIESNKFGNLLAIRQEEYFLLSQNTEKRVHSYIMWLADLDIIKSNMKIKEIVESIENLLGMKI